MMPLEEDPIMRAFGQGTADNVVQHPAAIAPPLTALPARLLASSAIPPRPWLYGTHLIRGFVSVLVAPGGVGKTQLSIAMALALASGKKLLGDHVHASVLAWVLNLEDPLDEIERRVAATMIHHRLRVEDVAGRLFLNSGRDRRVCIGRIETSDIGFQVAFPDKEAIIAEARRQKIGFIIVDPFVKSHALEENSNPHMDAAATAWGEIAQATGAAILLVHHVRKGSTTAEGMDAGRGGSALRDAARVGLTMAGMTSDEAKELGIPDGERWQYVRLDDAKANLAPKANRARWFRLNMTSLGNGTPEYPNGDTVAAIDTWEPPSVWQDLTPELLNRMLDIIDAGPGPGMRYSQHRTSKGDPKRWAGRVIMDLADLNEDQAQQIVKQWVRNGVLIEEEYRDEEARKDRKGLFVVAAKRPT